VAGPGALAAGDQHGPPLLVGFALGALLLWLDRRGRRAQIQGG
jgi:hypothetical protein